MYDSRGIGTLRNVPDVAHLLSLVGENSVSGQRRQRWSSGEQALTTTEMVWRHDRGEKASGRCWSAAGQQACCSGSGC